MFKVNQFIIRAINNSEIINSSLSKFNETKTIQCQKLSKMYNFGAIVLAVFFFSLLWLDHEAFQLTFSQALYVHCVVICLFHVENFVGPTSK
jgi:hypothetical protein